MEKYIVILWHNKGVIEFSLIGDSYPSYSFIVEHCKAMNISEDNIIDYEIHY